MSGEPLPKIAKKFPTLSHYTSLDFHQIIQRNVFIDCPYDYRLPDFIGLDNPLVFSQSVDDWLTDKVDEALKKKREKQQRQLEAAAAAAATASNPTEDVEMNEVESSSSSTSVVAAQRVKSTSSTSSISSIRTATKDVESDLIADKVSKQVRKSNNNEPIECSSPKMATITENEDLAEGASDVNSEDKQGKLI